MAKQAKIFISYSRRNSDFTHRLFDALVAHGYDPWVDFDDIPFSADWWSEIKEAIDKHDVIIDVVSSHSLLSRVCNEEILYAREHNKRIIPLIVEDVDIKYVIGELYDKPWDETARDNWVAIRKLNWIYFNRDDDFDTGIENMLRTVETDHEHMRNHTRLLTRAKEWEEYGRGRGFLLRGEELDDAEAWLRLSSGKDPQPVALHYDYIQTSRQAETEDEETLQRMRRQTRLLRRSSFGLVVTAVVVIGAILATLRGVQSTADANATAFALTAVSADETVAFAQQLAEEQVTRAAEVQVGANSLGLAVEAQLELDRGDPDQIGLPLGLAAFDLLDELRPSRRVLRIVSDNVYQPGLVRYFNAPRATDVTTETCADPDEEANAANTPGRAHEETIGGVLFSADGERVVSIGKGACLYVWDAATGDLQVSVTLEGDATSLALSPDDNILAVGKRDGTLTLWTLEGEQTGELDSSRTIGAIGGMAFSADGQYVFAGGNGGWALLWDLETADVVRATQTLRPITAVTAHPSELTFAVGQTETSTDSETSEEIRNGRVVVYQYDLDLDGEPDAGNGNRITLTALHQSTVAQLAFTLDGKGIVSLSANNRLFYRSGFNYQQAQVITLPGNIDLVTSMVPLPNNYLLTGSQENNLYLWDLTDFESGTRWSETNIQRTSNTSTDRGISALAAEAQGEFVAAGVENGRLLLFAITHGAIERQRKLYDLPPLTVGIDEDGSLHSLNFLGELIHWDPFVDDIETVSLRGLGVSEMLFLRYQDVALVTTTEGTVARLDLGTLELLPYEGVSINSPEGESLISLTGTVISADGTRALSPLRGEGRSLVESNTGIPAGQRILWDVETSEVIRDDIDLGALTDEITVNHIVLNADGTKLAVSVAEALYVADLTAETVTATNSYSRPNLITALLFGMPGAEDLLIVGYDNGQLSLTSLDGDEWETLTDRAEEIQYLDTALLPDPTTGELFPFMVTSSSDGAILLWDLEERAAVRRFETLSRGGNRVQFTPDNNYVITQADDGTAVLWRLDSPTELVEWTLENRLVAPLAQVTCDRFNIPEPCGPAEEAVDNTVATEEATS